MTTKPQFDGLTRREFGKIAGTSALGAALASSTTQMVFVQSANPADITKGVNDTMSIPQRQAGHDGDPAVAAARTRNYPK